MARTKNKHNNKGSLPQNEGENPSASRRAQWRWWQWVLIGLLAVGAFWLILRFLVIGDGGLVMERLPFLLGLALLLFAASVAGIVIALRGMRRR